MTFVNQKVEIVSAKRWKSCRVKVEIVAFWGGEVSRSRLSRSVWLNAAALPSLFEAWLPALGLEREGPQGLKPDVFSIDYGRD